MPNTFTKLFDRTASSALAGEAGKALVAGTIGLLFDGMLESARQAVRSMLVGDTEGPAYDAVGDCGREVSLPRVGNETVDDYLARIADPWAFWPYAGDEDVIIAQLALLGLTAEIHPLGTGPNEWNWDGDAANWSRFVVVITGHPWGPPYKLGAGKILDGTWTLGSTATPQEVRAVRNIVRKWKPGIWKCESIIVVLDATAWQTDAPPDGTWGDLGNRPTSAAYWSL